MAVDLGQYRVLADGAPPSSSNKDWYEQVKDSNSSAYEEVSDVLKAAGLNPQSTT